MGHFNVWGNPGVWVIVTGGEMLEPRLLKRMGESWSLSHSNGWGESWSLEHCNRWGNPGVWVIVTGGVILESGSL